MLTIEIAPELKNICPFLSLGCIECNVMVDPLKEPLWQLIQQKVAQISTELDPENIKTLPNIANTRAAYKALGKDPSRYRPSAEALLRRITQGRGIKQLNNVVDALNLVSITSGYSIGGYDAGKIEGNTITFGIGLENETYTAIGRGNLNIDRLPVFRDELGAFGSPTSDSVRTGVSLFTDRFLMIIINFMGHNGVPEAMEQAVQLLSTYAYAKEVETQLI